jgi:hypothetical protein
MMQEEVCTARFGCLPSTVAVTNATPRLPLRRHCNDGRAGCAGTGGLPRGSSVE